MALLGRLHAKIGDFWWYSLMIFCAQRAADGMNVFVGLYLVPKYVDPTELGAVMPLTSFANFLAIPIAVFASTFRNELSSLAANRKFGQMKTLMRGVFVATAIFLFLAIVICRIVLPAYLERIRIAEGSLGLVILVSSFVATIAPIYTNALQSFKKFGANSLINLIGAPVRLIAIILLMPFRALTGYFAGQTTHSAFSIIAALFSLRKELRIPAEPYWTRKIIRRFGRVFIIFGIITLAGSFSGLVESTIIRQRLPELDSAAYYIATRFSEIAGFLASAIAFTIFPFSSELAAQEKDVRPLFTKSIIVISIANLLLTVFFFMFGAKIISLLPHGNKYVEYWWALPWLAVITTGWWIFSLYTTIETAANRFGFIKWTVPLNILNPLALLLITGHGYFNDYIPSSWSTFLSSHNISSLKSMLWWLTAFNAIKTIGCFIALRHK